MNAFPEPPQQPDSPWTGEIETLGACPVCASPSRTLLYPDMRDIVFHVAPGTWNMFHCDSCGSRYIDPRPSRASIILAYDAYFTHKTPKDQSLLAPRTLARRLRNDYLASRFGYALPNREPFGRYLVRAIPPRRRRYERLVRDLPAPQKPGARLLDVGCGNGEFLVRMRDLGWHVSGHEPDPKAAAVVRSLGIEVSESPLGPSSFAEPFDAITLHHVIEHVHDPVETLTACRQLLAPGGTLWIATPNGESLSARRFGRHWFALDCPRHLIVFDVRSLDLALERAGFTRRTVNGDLGMYGTVGTAVQIARLARGGRRIHRLEAHLHNALGDLAMLLRPSFGDDLVAVART